MQKNRLEKFPFIPTNDWIVVAVCWSVKFFFAPNSSVFQNYDNYGKRYDKGKEGGGGKSVNHKVMFFKQTIKEQLGKQLPFFSF